MELSTSQKPNVQGIPFSTSFSSINDEIQSVDTRFSEIKGFWNLYQSSFPPEKLDINIHLHKLICFFFEVSKRSYFRSLFEIIKRANGSIEVIVKYPQLMKTVNQIEDDHAIILAEVFDNFGEDPSSILTSLSLVLHNYLNCEKKLNLVIEEFPEIELIEIRAQMVEMFVSFKAIVLKVYHLKLMVTGMNFQCFDCKASFTHYFLDGSYTLPNKCFNKNKKDCKGRVFVPQKETVKAIFIQRIKLQELDSEGRVPRQMACELRQNLVGRVTTGETLTVSGIIKTESADQKDKKTQGIFSPYIVANSLVQKSEGSDKYDMKKISKMKQNSRIFYSLIKSFCPTIYGHEMVKAGLLLGLIGGSSKNLSRESTFRQTSHVLLLGDPGLGKSQLLKFAVEILPHSIYVSATSVSQSGLTVTVNKENNDQSLEAGALILADSGICAIDQFDKTSDSSALLQVMEQQTISIAKAGIICQLKCRVGIFASANPIQGSYKKQKSFKQNTKISNAILSRFDLIFLLMDTPDPERDQKLSQHIMKIHNQNRKKHPEDRHIKQRQFQKMTSYLSLREKLISETERQQCMYNLDEMKQYMSYIRKEIHPTLSSSAAEVLKGFYLALRENNPSNSFQITNRQLQSLVRLAMARARIECRDQVTEDDAIEVTNLMQESLFDAFEQMGYNVNSLRNDVKKVKVNKKNSELSLPKQRALFISKLNEVTNERQNNVWQWNELVKTAKELDLNIGDFHNFIERLNIDGVLLQRGGKRWAFQGTYV